VVDLSQPRIRATGVYPGGQSGNPFSILYDAHIPTYLSFQRYDLLRPASEADLPAEDMTQVLTLRPRSIVSAQDSE
jgi:hypothetical protein